jgi:hypothetical protein
LPSDPTDCSAFLSVVVPDRISDREQQTNSDQQSSGQTHLRESTQRIKDLADVPFLPFSNVNAAIPRSIGERNHFPEDLKVFDDLGIAELILDDGWKIVYELKAGGSFSYHDTVALFKRYFDIGYRVMNWEM